MERWAERQEVVSVQWLAHALRRQWKWVATGVVLGVALALAIALFSERRYEAEAKILVETPTGMGLGAGGTLASLVGGGSPDLNTQAEVLTARPLLEKVQQDAGFDEPYLDFAKRFRATPVRNTNIVQITASDSTADGAQRLAQLWAQNYLEYVRTLYEQNPSTLIQKLSRELDNQERRLQTISQRLTAFLKRRQMVAPEQELTKAVEKYADLLEQARNLEAQRLALERQIDAIQNELQRQPRFYEATRNLAIPPEVQALNTKIAELEIQRSGLLQEFQPNAPEVKILEEQIAQAKREREQILARAVDQQFLTLAKQEAVNPVYQDLLKGLLEARSNLQATEATRAVLQRQQAQFEQLFRQTPDTMAEYADLKRQYEAALTVWTEKVRAYEQARAQQLIGKLSPILLQPPALPDRPVFPRPVLTTGLGIVLGLMLGIFLALGAAFRNRTLTDRWEVERLLGAPVLLEARGALPPAQVQLLGWQLRALGGGEVWHSAAVMPLAAHAKPLAQQLAGAFQHATVHEVEANLPAVPSTNGALTLLPASPDAPAVPDAERLILIAPKGYTLDEATYRMLQQTGDRLVGVILIEESRA
jgi:succinoglycan biosynthesis transport protein ExoP